MMFMLNQACIVETADGNSTCIHEVLQGKNIDLLVHNFKENLLPNNLVRFDVILRMDWLEASHARIQCSKNYVEIRMPTGETITNQGDKVSRPTKFISVMKATKYLRKQGIVYMISVIISIKGKELNEIPVVSEYSDVFPEDLPGQPPDCEIEFRIHVIPGTTPIAKAPYRLVPNEMLD
ncbi:uncharacterized protein LOC143543538 [Bidens hawaiensis]|uniref:uncharacterized protein LOC143543538 n=1 Tax=Bidens hawaiensis TaxID=980011 RepID=UPI0040491302